jgi:hypothetical protein
MLHTNLLRPRPSTFNSHPSSFFGDQTLGPRLLQCAMMQLVLRSLPSKGALMNCEDGILLLLLAPASPTLDLCGAMQLPKVGS